MMKLQIKVSKFKKLSILIIVLVGFSFSCNFDFIKTKNESVALNGVENTPNIDVEKQINDLVKIEVKKIGDQQVEIIVRNLTSKKIFLPYFKGGEDKYAHYAIFQIQKKEETSDEFKSIGFGHLGTGLKPLEGGDFYKYVINVIEKGTYRFCVSYLVDEQLVRRISEYHNLEGEKRKIESEELIQKSKVESKTVISDVIEL